MFNKHYIRKNEANDIIKVFSDAFERPEDGDICVNENGDRHYNLDIKTGEGYYKYKYIDNEIIEKTEDEIYTLDTLKSNKIIKIKQIAFNIIVAKYPKWKQRNLTARFVELVDKESLIEEEQTEKDNILAVWVWVKNIRNQSDIMEDEINSLSIIFDVKNYSIEYNEGE